jgi:S-adenosylmethionine synthetase
MARNIMVEEYRRPDVAQRVEVVERKGIGHPDTMCDSICNQISVDLCEEYLKRFGAILHHNIDKSLLVAGRAKVGFGGGKVEEPMLMIFGDRATWDAEGQHVAVDEIAVKTAKKWLKENLRVDPDKGMRYQVEIKPGSAELTDIFRRKGEILGSNDTSAAVGYAPLSPLENLVLHTEKHINSKEFKKRYPEVGEDIKVMGLRTDKDVLLTIAMAFVDRYVKNEDDYFKKKAEVTEAVKQYASKYHDSLKDIKVDINTLDEKGRGINGVYVTVTGTSAEDADCGQVGRGNRVNGIIPLNRPIGSEAAAGKNPVSHVGKIYNVLTHRIADRVQKNVDGVDEVYIWLLSQIGKQIDHPAIAAAQVALRPGIKMSDVDKAIHDEIDAELADIKKFTMELAHGKIPIC